MTQLGLPLDWTAFAETVPWLRRLDDRARERLLQRASVLKLAGGDTLFEAGSASDCLYILRSGSLGAFVGAPGSTMIGQVVAGETVGETGLITGSPRGASVRALRDSELLRVPREAFEEVATSEPGMLRQVARLALSRATATARNTPARSDPAPSPCCRRPKGSTRARWPMRWRARWCRSAAPRSSMPRRAKVAMPAGSTRSRPAIAT
jgi:CRP-like cAMP-binding protein